MYIEVIKKTKQYFAIFLVAILIAVSFSGCTKTKETANEKTTKSESAEKTADKDSNDSERSDDLLTPTPTETPIPENTSSSQQAEDDGEEINIQGFGDSKKVPVQNPNNDTDQSNTNNANNEDSGSGQTSIPAAANGRVIAIDAGHQAQGDSTQEPIGPGATETKPKVAGGTTGTTTGVAEYVLNLDVSLKLRDELQNRGYRVYMIRETHDVNISNASRAQMANESGADILLRIHANGSDDSSVQGALCMSPSSSNAYVAGIASSCQSLSEQVVQAYCNATDFNNLGVQNYDNMTGINWSTIPVTIVEMGFMTNPSDDTAMQQQDMQYKMAAGIANGVDAYFGIDS